MGRALARHDAILRDAVAAHGGNVWKGGGDGIYALFAVPGEALAAAAAACRALAAEDWSASIAVPVRMAVATGVAEPRADDWYGPAVNRAARLLAACRSGQ